jgi:hypothetical protein
MNDAAVSAARVVSPSLGRNRTTAGLAQIAV